MNPPGTELLLAIALIALYVQDSALLLHFDEVLVSGGRRGWRVSTGSDLELRGRFLFVPQPLLPASTLFRASWLHPEGASSEDPGELAAYAARLRLVRIGCMVVGAAILVALPALLLTSRNPWWMLATIVVAYLAIITMLVALFLQRHALALGGGKLASLAVESMLCPPHAVNLYRRLCALRGFRGDPVQFAARALEGNERLRLLAAIKSRIAPSTRVDDDLARTDALHAARKRIAATLA